MCAFHAVPGVALSPFRTSKAAELLSLSSTGNAAFHAERFTLFPPSLDEGETLVWREETSSSTNDDLPTLL